LHETYLFLSLQGDPHLLCRTRVTRALLAFVNLYPSYCKGEAVIDLMRRRTGRRPEGEARDPLGTPVRIHRNVLDPPLLVIALGISGIKE
jgi:hypothetical protein